jgi:hypothetical protein
MSFDMTHDGSVGERRMQRLQHRYRRAQNALAGARAVYAALREMPGARTHQVHQAWLQVQQAQQYLSDLQASIELEEEQREIA